MEDDLAKCGEGRDPGVGFAGELPEFGVFREEGAQQEAFAFASLLTLLVERLGFGGVLLGGGVEGGDERLAPGRGEVDRDQEASVGDAEGDEEVVVEVAVEGAQLRRVDEADRLGRVTRPGSSGRKVELVRGEGETFDEHGGGSDAGGECHEIVRSAGEGDGSDGLSSVGFEQENVPELAGDLLEL